ncbi:unnamed protein product [Chondrus crispus]|uniref:Methyltransferase type 12 domain-containing protein n=1 Tax=Chondrus crispus TaxID=2769 RepID=R7QNX6_CHOCR|nr:unnamed protein product [Chondrus crispus]CDF39186.1 unnamed protein product [Chondrus crispus]|eukprot:XP_005719097.1 unnamed protein product [Chondrus crispus]
MTAFVPLLAPPPLRSVQRAGHISLRPMAHTTRRQQAPRMVAKPENEPDVAVSSTVERLYDTYPFPPETLLDEAPIGYNWRWHHPSAYSFCTGRIPPPQTKPLRILDAGCGTGESTSYLVHLNPGAQVTGIDLSAGALKIAEERLRRSVPEQMERVELLHKSIFDAAELEGQFDHINCVGVVHHTPDPLRAVRALAEKLAPGGILHIFVYAAHGRWEISLMQRALKLLQNGKHEFEDGVKLGRKVFAALPDGNRLKKRENDRWAQENTKDATFADMYLHPQEVDYDIPSLFELIDQSGLEFVGFSNPRTWDIKRVLGNDEEICKRAEGLSERDLYGLIECLDPEAVTHFEFFLTKPPLQKYDWKDDATLERARATMSECITGWPSNVVMDRDYVPIMLSDGEREFLEAITKEGGGQIAKAVAETTLNLDGVRLLVQKGVMLLAPEE